VLQDNGGDNLTLMTNGTASFATRIASGGAYAVTVLTQPAGPAQPCTVLAGTGTATANVSIAVTCVNVGHYVFVANPQDGAAGSVAAFTITPTTGALLAAAGSPYTPGGVETAPAGLALDPNNDYLYVADSASADVSTWGIGAGGVLTPDAVMTSPASTGTVTNAPYSLAFDPAGFLYVGSNDNPNGTVEGFSVSNGALTKQATSPYPSGNVPYSLALDPSAAFLYAPNVIDGKVSEYSITAGVLSNPPAYDNTLTNPYAVAVYPGGGFVYITDNTADIVQEYTYDPATGILTAGTATGDSLPTGATPQGIAIDPTGSFLYTSNSGDGTVSAFTINPGTGALTAVAGTFQSTTTNIPSITPTALAVDPSSQYLYVANGDDGTITVFSIAAATGALNPVGSKVPCTNGAGGPRAIVVQ